MKETGMVKLEKSAKERRDEKRNAVVNTVKRLLSHLSFMEIMNVSCNTPEMFIDVVIPIKDYFIALSPLLGGMRINDNKLKDKIDHFFSLVHKDMDLNQTIEAYEYLKSIKY